METNKVDVYLTYKGKVITRADKVVPVGINYEVTYDTGYKVITPKSKMTEDLLALA